MSDYCINVCHGKCCREGKLLILSDNERKAIIPDEKFKEFLENGKIEISKTNNKWIHLNNDKCGGCPNLKKNSRCKIYTNPNKPKVCGDFPIVRQELFITASDFCPAVKEKRLDEYMEKLKELGCKIL